MTPYTPQEIQTFGAGIIALAIIFGGIIYSILKLAPILGKINTHHQGEGPIARNAL